MSGFNTDDYVDVAQRIHDFYEKYPDGRLVTVDWEVKPDLDGKTFVWVHAKAFRTPDDPLPGDGLAWEPVPGPTQFTRDSELMNAQTAAWGRAIVALGFDTKKIASRQEVQALQANGAGNGDLPQAMVMPFGKHKGEPISDVPRDYLEWWLGQDDGRNPDLRVAVELHLGLTDQPAGDLEEIPF